MRTRPVIVHVLPWQFGVGGAQRFMVDLVNWASNFADVHIFYRVGKDNFYEPKASLHLLDKREDAVRKLYEINPDLVHYHNPFLTFLFPDVTEYPLVGTPHGFEHNQPSFIKPYVYPIIGDHANRIYNGIPVDQFTVKKHEAKETVVVGFVARRAIEKYPEGFLEAMRNRLPKNCHFKAVGCGWKLPALDHITGVLTSLGFELIDNVLLEDIPQQYATFDMFVLPSVIECCPYVLMEAMASGLPCIVRNSGGMPEIVGDAGITCDTDDDFVDAIERLQDDVALRKELGEKGRARAEKLFTIERMYSQYDEVYSRLTNGLVRKPDPNLDASVVIPVWNTRPDWFKECMDSVLSQDGNFEIVLVDDASSNPDTVSLMRQYAEQPNIRYFRQEVHGGSGPTNTRGVREAKSDIIIKIDSDDMMTPGRIAKQIDYLKSHPDVALYAGQMQCVQDGKQLPRMPLRYNPDYPLWSLSNPIAHSTVAMRRYPALASGGYPTGYCQDFALWCKMQRAGYKMVVSEDETFAIYRVYGSQALREPEKKEWDSRIRKQFSGDIVQGQFKDQIRSMVLELETKLSDLKRLLGFFEV